MSTPSTTATSSAQPSSFTLASIIIPTFDRPTDLEICLSEIVKQHASIPLEFIVVDNHPETDLTPPVVKKFPSVKVVPQQKKGLSFARNAGIVSSAGDVLLFIDDDIIVEEGWAEAFIQAFTRDDIMAVTGRVLPLSQQTPAERLFEAYASFDRGDHPKEFGTAWFRSYTRRSVPTHHVGGGGNCAIRRVAFLNPLIGLFNETFGAGTPLGSAEDQYMWYRILSAGFTIVYTPHARGLHKHRVTEEALYKQIHAYSRSIVGYELECLHADGERRALLQLAFVLPIWRIRQLARLGLYALRHGRPSPDAKLVMTDIRGDLAGWGLWRTSRKRADQLGRTVLIR